MSEYKVVLRRSAEKELAALPNQAIARIIVTLKGLENEPRPHGCKKLKGQQNLWRLRVGDYRIVYSIEEVILLIDVRKIGDRKNVYD